MLSDASLPLQQLKMKVFHCALMQESAKEMSFLARQQAQVSSYLIDLVTRQDWPVTMKALWIGYANCLPFFTMRYGNDVIKKDTF